MKLSACMLAALCCGILGAQPRIDPDDIGGVVTSPKGPEAGVWVIAETTDLPTQLHQNRGHRRPRALRAAGSAEGELQRWVAATGWWIRRKCRRRPARR